MKALSLCILSLMVLFIAGCTSGNGNVVYSGTFEGRPFTVRTHETHTFNGSRTDWRLKLEGHAELPINVTLRRGTPISLEEPVTTDWGPPYSDDTYGKYDRIYLSTATSYSNTPDDYSDTTTRQHDYTMLYMPAGASGEDFTVYSRLLKTQWAVVDKALTADDGSYFPHIIGLVNAPRDFFVKRYRGAKAGVGYLMRIDPDGYVNFGPDEPTAEVNHMRHSPVQMPRKAIRIHTIYNISQDGWTVADFRKFRNSSGDSIEAYFRLEK